MNEWTQLPLSDPPLFDEASDVLVRQSTIGQLQLCEMRWGYRTHPKYLAPVSEPMAFGTCAHYMCEQDLRSGEERLDLLTNMGEWVDGILREQYDWSISLVDNPQEFFSELGVAYRTWRQQIRPKLPDNPVGIETLMQMHLGPAASGEVHLQGTPDVIYEEYLRDFKTAGRGWKADKANVSIQASLYPALVKENFDGLELKDFIFDVYDRSKSTWTSFPVKRRVKDINAALRTAYATGLKLEAGLFTAQPVPEASFVKRRGWYCKPKFCGAWNACEFKYLADDIDESELAIRSWKG